MDTEFYEKWTLELVKNGHVPDKGNLNNGYWTPDSPLTSRPYQAFCELQNACIFGKVRVQKIFSFSSQRFEKRTRGCAFFFGFFFLMVAQNCPSNSRSPYKQSGKCHLQYVCLPLGQVQTVLGCGFYLDELPLLTQKPAFFRLGVKRSLVKATSSRAALTMTKHSMFKPLQRLQHSTLHTKSMESTNVDF